MTIVFSIFFHEIKREKNLKNLHFKKVIKNDLIVFFKYDPRYSICSHVLPFDATVLIFYMKLMNDLLRLGKMVKTRINFFEDTSTLT